MRPVWCEFSFRSFEESLTFEASPSPVWVKPGSPRPALSLCSQVGTGGVARPSVRGQQERGGVGAPPLSSPAPGSARVLLWGPGRAFLLPLYGGRCLCFMRGVLASIHPPRTPPPRVEVGLNEVGAAGSGRSAWWWGLV